MGITSEKQLVYEEKVIRAIAKKYGGTLLSSDYKPEVLDALKPGILIASGMCAATGCHGIFILIPGFAAGWQRSAIGCAKYMVCGNKQYW